MSSIFEEIDERNNMARRSRDHGMLTDRQEVEELSIPIAYILINEIDSAFQTAPALGGLSVFNMHNAPDANNVLIQSEFGKASSQALANHYGRRLEDKYQCNTTVSDTRFTAEHLVGEFNGFKYQLLLMRYWFDKTVSAGWCIIIQDSARGRITTVLDCWMLPNSDWLSAICQHPHPILVALVQ